MNNFTALSYDQVIQRIQQHKPDIDHSIYLYESIELRQIVPVFFLKQRMKKQTVNGDGIHWRYADFCGWAAAYDDQLNDLYSIGKTYSDSDSVNIKRAALIQPIKVFQWESIQDIDESWDIDINPPFWPWHFYDDVVINLSRAQVNFWVTDASELNKSNQSDTATAATAYLATIGALLALLKNQSRKHTQDSLINEIQKMKDAEFPYARGLSRSQLGDTFAAANKAFKDLKEQ